jgi:N-acyl-D-amino-acid deacylase
MKTLLKNGMILDGTGEKAFTANLLIDGDRIAAIGSIDDACADEVIDMTGKCVAPGFIDAHSHNDWFAARSDNSRFFAPFVQQGITTQVTGNCGFSPFGFEPETPHRALLGSGLFSMEGMEVGGYSRLSGFFEHCKRLPVNIVPFYGHMSGRISVSGYENRALTELELSRLDGMLEQALLDGAAGISLGLMYEPDRYAPYDELKRAAQIAARHGKILSVHARACSAASTSYQPPIGGRAHNLRALDEMIKIARETGVKVQFSHLIFVGSRSWRTADEALELICQANSEGLAFMYDSYAMTFGASIITVILPNWYLSLAPEKRRSPVVRMRIALEIGVTKRILGFDFNDIVMAWVADGQEALCGRSVHQIALEWRMNDLDAYLKLVELSGGKGRVLMHKYLTDNILMRLMNDPNCLCMTDAWLEEKGMQNPACFNCFPEFLRLAKERGMMEKTMRQMTGATADRFHIQERGYLKEGYIADITVFDPKEIRPSDMPEGKPHGIGQVYIAGQPVLKDGELVNNALGRMLLQKEQ